MKIEPEKFLLLEYEALRAEIMKRTDIQHQLISIILVSFGALVSVGLSNSSTALLAYPLLAVFLSAVWSYNDIRIRQLGTYIRNKIEANVDVEGVGWEHIIVNDRSSKLVSSRTILATRGILWGTEILAVGLYLIIRQNPLGIEWDIALLALDSIAILMTIILLRRQDVTPQQIAETMKNPRT